MKKQLLASFLSLFLVAGFAPIAVSATTNSSTSSSSVCPLDQSSSCAYKVLTKEECHRFCKAKADAIAKNPSLAKPENRRKLWRAIVKADPSIKPICVKLRKSCCKMKKQDGTSYCKQSGWKDKGCCQDTVAPKSSCSSVQQDIKTSGSPVSSTAAPQRVTPQDTNSQSASSTQQSTNTATSAK